MFYIRLHIRCLLSLPGMLKMWRVVWNDWCEMFTLHKWVNIHHVWSSKRWRLLESRCNRKSVISDKAGDAEDVEDVEDGVEWMVCKAFISSKRWWLLDGQCDRQLVMCDSAGHCEDVGDGVEWPVWKVYTKKVALWWSVSSSVSLQWYSNNCSGWITGEDLLRLQ